MPAKVLIVGAGPAGMRAAETLVVAGLRPTVIDEGARFGGQIYRQAPAVLSRDRKHLYGFEAGKAAAVLDRFATLLPQLDYRPDTLVLHIENGRAQTLHRGRDQAIEYDRLILATGATDRILPFPGWTLPGVFTLGAAQVALKYQACLIGPRVVFAGTGPLLYLVAWQYASHGANVAAVLDTAGPGDKLRGLAGLAARPATLAKGGYYLARLRMAGVPVHSGVRLIGGEGETRLTGISWQARGKQHTISCDALGFGYGLRSETQLADLAGCRFEWHAIDQAWLPSSDAAGRSSVPGVYLAGDGAAILGADAAERAGTRAALSLLEDQGQAIDAASVARLARERETDLRFRAGAEAAFALPGDWAAQLPDDTIVCRCEEITAGELRACQRETGVREMNRLKALSRIGMGRCQGRMCSAAAARLLAHQCGRELSEVGSLRGQAPVKPLPIHLLREQALRGTPVPAEERDD